MLRRRHRNWLAPVLETMEPRQLLSSSGDDELPACGPSLDILATNGDDHIVVTLGPKHGDITIVSAPGYADGTELHRSCNIVIDGGDGNDTIEITASGVNLRFADRLANITLRGGNGDDILLGGDEVTTLDGGPGNDTLTGRTARFNWLAEMEFSGTLHGVNVRLDQGLVLDDGFGTQDQVSGIGSVRGTPFDDTMYNAYYGSLSGQGGNDFLEAGAGGELIGGAGDDTLKSDSGNTGFSPGSGNDTVIGGPGIDTIYYWDNAFENGRSLNATSGMIVRLDRGLIENDGYGGVDTISSIEAVWASFSKLPVVMYGTDADETLVGGWADDLIVGGGGNDYLVGGNGATVLGGEGNDTIGTDMRFNHIDGGPGADTINSWGCKYDHDDIVPDENDTINLHFYTGSQDCLDGPAKAEKSRVKKHKHHHPGVKAKRHRDLPTAARLFRR